MKFRPCIDIHNGKVKQLVGSTLRDDEAHTKENYVSEHDAAWFARFYTKDGLEGGHIIMLNPVSAPQYRVTKEQALLALRESPGHFQLGGGVTPYNAEEFLDAGASAVIVTSYVFQDGTFNRRHLEKIVSAVGKEHLVLDLSCRKRGDEYYIYAKNEGSIPYVMVRVYDYDSEKTFLSDFTRYMQKQYKDLKVTSKAAPKTVGDKACWEVDYSYRRLRISHRRVPA